MRDRFSWGAMLVIGILAPLIGCDAPSSLTSIAVTPSTITFGGPGLTLQLKAMGTYSHGNHPVNVVDITDQVAWFSPVQGEALSVTSTGMLTSLATCQNIPISASAPGFTGTVTGSMTATVTSNGTGNATLEPIISMIVTPSTPTAANGQSIDFMAIGTTPSGATKDLTTQVVWSAANKGVATIIPASGVATTQGPGTTQINAVWTNPDMTMVNGTSQLTVTGTGSSSSEPLISTAIYPTAPSVASPGISSQLVDIGTFSKAPITQDVSSGIASYPITTAWSSSSPSVATVTTACPTGITAESCTISACPGTSAAGVCTSCPGTAVADGPSCATLNPTTPAGLVTGVSQGTTAILAISSNPDQNLVYSLVPFTVVSGASGQGATQQVSAITIEPNPIAATFSTEQNQFIALATEGTEQFDVTNQVVWKSGTPSVGTICTAVAGVNPVTPISCATTPGQVTAVNPGSSNITATWTNADHSTVVGQASYSVTIGSQPEPLVSINVVPGSVIVSNKGMTQQYLAFGNYTTIPTTRDITNSVTWITLDPDIASINSSSSAGEDAGLATAIGGEGLGVIYAQGQNPDGTLVLSNPVTFTCDLPGSNPAICDQAEAPSLLATLTVFNAGSNDTNWLITDENTATSEKNLIHCGPGSEIAGLGNSVCTGTYASGSVVKLTASLAGKALDSTFGGWTSNCDTATNTPDTNSTCSLPSADFAGGQSAGALFYGLSLNCSATTTGTVGTSFNSSPITVSNGTGADTFSVVGTLPTGLTLNANGSVTGTPTVAGSFAITAVDANGTNSGENCPITIVQ